MMCKIVVEVRDQLTKKITNIEQWTDAFLLYIAISLERHPADTPDILKYLQIIRTMSANAHSKLFMSYDRNFCKLRARNSMPWCNIHQELFHPVTCEANKAEPKKGVPFEETALSSAFSENTVLSRGILLRLLCHRALQKCGVHLLPHVPNTCPINRHVKSPGFVGRLPVLSYIWSPGRRRKSPGF